MPAFFMLRIIKQIRLPRGTGGLVAKLRAENEFLLRHREVVQIDARDGGSILAMLAKFEHLYPHRAQHQDSFLLFRRVTAHNDNWSRVSHGGRLVAPAFAHLVLHGKAAIRVGRKSASVRAGDLWAMDPNVDHEVTSDCLCVTAVATVPRLVAQQMQ